MADTAKPKHLDLTQSDPDHIDSPNPPVGRTGQILKGKIEIQLGIILPVACVLLVAIVAHRWLEMSSTNSMVSGFAVVMGASVPQYATTILRTMSNLLRKFKN
jgi:hypothetical protein